MKNDKFSKKVKGERRKLRIRKKKRYDLYFICLTYIFYVLVLYLFDVYVNLCKSYMVTSMKIASNITHCLILHSTMACLNALRSWSLIIRCGFEASLGDNRLYHLPHCPQNKRVWGSSATTYRPSYHFYEEVWDVWRSHVLSAEHRSTPSRFPTIVHLTIWTGMHAYHIDTCRTQNDRSIGAPCLCEMSSRAVIIDGKRR